MRKELFYKPELVLERLAMAVRRRARLGKLKHTCAKDLRLGHIGSLELLELVREKDIRCIYDIGASVGTWTLLAKAIIPEANVEAFEPYSPHVEVFMQKAINLDRVRLHVTALGAANGTRKFYVTDFSDASSILRPIKDAQLEIGEAVEIEVPVSRLDHYRQEHDLPAPELVKIDVQGFELEVLKGAEESLATTLAVICEVSFAKLYEGQCLFADLVGYLSKIGFAPTAFSVPTAVGVRLLQTDVLFERIKM